MERIAAQTARVSEDLGPLEYHPSEYEVFRRGTFVSHVLHTYVRRKGAKAWNDLQSRLEP